MRRNIKNKSSLVKKLSIAAALVIVILCGIWALIAQTYKHHWSTVEAAYALKNEYILSNTLNIFRLSLAKAGLSSSSFVGRPLQKRHAIVTAEALKKIPAGDGEKIIWQIWYETDFWNDVVLGRDLSQNLPESFSKFEQLITLPTKSPWASVEKNLYAYKLANYYLHNYLNANFSSAARYEETKKLVLQMNAHAKNLHPALFDHERKQRKILPLLWENSLLVGATHIIVDPQTKSVRCDAEILRTLTESKKRAGSLVALYSPRVEGESKEKVEKIAYKLRHDLVKFESLINSQCGSA